MNKSQLEYLKIKERHDAERAEKQEADQEAQRRYAAIVEALTAVGVEVEPHAPHIRRPGLVTLNLDNAENLVAVLTP